MKIHHKNSDFERFKLVYRGGFGLAVIVLFLVKILGIPDYFLLFTGLVHILCLVYLANKVKNISYLVVSAGNRIQTAGYLHTLIGFAAALLVLSKPGFQVSDLSIPLATKLSTSLFGWLFGGEFIAEGEADNVSIQEATTELISEIQRYTSELRTTNDKTLHSMKTASNSYLEEMQKSHDKVLTSIENKYSTCLKNIEKLLDDHNKEMKILYIEVMKESKSLNDAINNFSLAVLQSSQSLSDSLNESNIKISEGANKIRKSIDEYDTILRDVNNHSKDVVIMLSGLSTSLTNFKDEIEKTTSSASNLTGKIDMWAIQTIDMTGRMNSVVTNLQNLITHIMSLTKSNKP